MEDLPPHACCRSLLTTASSCSPLLLQIYSPSSVEALATGLSRGLSHSLHLSHFTLSYGFSRGHVHLAAMLPTAHFTLPNLMIHWAFCCTPFACCQGVNNQNKHLSLSAKHPNAADSTKKKPVAESSMHPCYTSSSGATPRTNVQSPVPHILHGDRKALPESREKGRQ